NGDGLQQTAYGLLVWRKADNWTAFTNGSMTWINGPLGLQSRPNDQLLDWEAAEPTPTASPTTAPTAVPTPTLAPSPTPPRPTPVRHTSTPKKSSGGGGGYGHHGGY